MNKLQNVDFRSVTDFLEYLPDKELKIVEALRSLILECIPDVKEKLSYNVPYYHRYSAICFIWPGSVPWGKVIKKGVELGFCKGHLLADPFYLNKGSRKQVYIKTFFSLKDIDWDITRQLIYEAVVIDEEEHQRKKKK